MGRLVTPLLARANATARGLFDKEIGFAPEMTCAPLRGLAAFFRSLEEGFF
jgi:hypothetical protein